jgi:hypothetical protein
VTKRPPSQGCYTVPRPIEDYFGGVTKLSIPEGEVAPTHKVVLFDPEFAFAQFPVEHRTERWVRLGPAIPWDR